MTWEPWATGIDSAERRARQRSMRALALVHCRYETNFINTLRRAEVDDTALPVAYTEMGKLPALRRHHLLASYALLIGVWEVEFLTDGELGLEIIEDPPPLQTTNGTTALLRFYFAPYSFPDPASIARREWLYGRHYIRGGISASVGAPGRAKSTTVLSEIMSMAVGRDLLTGESLPAGPLSAAYLNGEGTQDELDPRVAVICQHTGILPEDFGDRLFASAGRW